MNNNPLGFAITMAAFAFFIVCPRMGAMTNLLERHTSYPIYWLVIRQHSFAADHDLAH